MCDLIITDAAALLPDGSVQSGQTIEIKEGKICGIRPKLVQLRPGQKEERVVEKDSGAGG